MIQALIQKWDHMQHFLFYRNKVLAHLYEAAALAHLAMWGILAANIQTVYQPKKEFITLHYKVGIGPDFVGPWYLILLFPLFGCAVLISHCALSRIMYRHDRFSSGALAVSALCLQGVISWALFLIIKANLF